MRSSHISPIWAVALAAGAVAQQSDPCCSNLSEALPDLVFFPNSSEYETSVNRRWSSTAILQPACVFLPTSADDISKAFGVIVEGQCLFSTKAGGHNANPGADSIDGGISIDLKQINTIVVSEDKSVVTVGTGNPWFSVYKVLDGLGIGVAGALSAGPGVGGLVIGGGLSPFAPLMGWTVDTIRSYQIVLPSGCVVNASATSHPDLYKALKGGGPNFGIVTHVDMETMPFDQLWGGLVTYSLEGPQANQSAMINAASEAMAESSALTAEDGASVVYMAIGYLSNNGGRLLLAALSNMDGIENAPALEPFMDLPNQVQTQLGHMNFSDFSLLVDAFQPSGFRQVTATITIKADKTTLQEILTQGDTIYDALSFKDQIDWVVFNGLLPKAQQTHAAANGGNVLGLTAEFDTIFMWFTSRWADPSLDDMMADVRDQWVELASSIAEENNALVPFIYLNAAGPNQDPLCSYGRDNMDLLRTVAQKVDEGKVMQIQSPGGFKISKANC